MNRLDTELFCKMFLNAAELIIEKEPYLTEIDSVIGDGDHGIGMKRGWLAVKNLLVGKRYLYVDDLCYEVSIELLKTMGGASGVIFGTMFLGGAGSLPHKSQITARELCLYFTEGEKSIELRGKAKPGDKTMVDALYPACRAMARALVDSDDILLLFKQASEASKQGAKASEYMKSRMGRSKNFRDKTLGLPDPGAVSTSFLFQAFYETVRKNEEK